MFPVSVSPSGLTKCLPRAANWDPFSASPFSIYPTNISARILRLREGPPLTRITATLDRARTSVGFLAIVNPSPYRLAPRPRLGFASKAKGWICTIFFCFKMVRDLEGSTAREISRGISRGRVGREEGGFHGPVRFFFVRFGRFKHELRLPPG